MISEGKNHIGRIFGGLNLTEFALFSLKKKMIWKFIAMR